MRRAGPQEAVSRPRRDDAPPRRRRRAPADDVLALQQAAGNRAVSALLARQPHTKPAPAKPVPKEAEQHASHVLMPGIGRLPVVSFSWSGETHSVGPGKADLRDIHITSSVGPHSVILQNAVAEGRHFKQAELVHHGSSDAGVRIKMTDVLIASYQLAGGMTEVQYEQWSLNFASVEHEQIRD